MAFVQFKLDKIDNQTRGIFDVYVYEPDNGDTINDILMPNYFEASRFRDDPDWPDAYIIAKASDGYTILNVDESGTAKTISGNVNYRDLYQPVTYSRNDMALDGPYLGVSLVDDNEDRLAPQTVGDAFYLYDGTLGSNGVSARQVIVGQRYKASGSGALLSGYRINTVVGNVYRIFSVKDPNGTPIVTEQQSFTGLVNGFVEFNIDAVIIPQGVEFDIVAIVQEPDPSPDIRTGFWDYQTPNNFTQPAPGQIIHPGKDTSTLSISTTDDDGGDRSSDLALVEVGDIIEGAGVRWSVQSVSDQVTYYDFVVAPASQGAPDGRQEFSFEITVPQPITYGEDVGFWSGNDNVRGLLAVDDDYQSITPDDNQYSIDILVQEVVVSDKWRILAPLDATTIPTIEDSNYVRARRLTDLPFTNTVDGTVIEVDTIEEVKGITVENNSEITITEFGFFYNFQFEFNLSVDAGFAGNVEIWVETLDQDGVTWNILPVSSKVKDYSVFSEGTIRYAVSSPVSEETTFRLKISSTGAPQSLSADTLRNGSIAPAINLSITKGVKI